MYQHGSFSGAGPFQFVGEDFDVFQAPGGFFFQSFQDDSFDSIGDVQTFAAQAGREIEEVLVDATIIRSLLAPATMRLLGRWNWWLPGRPIPREQPGAIQ